LSGKIDYAYGQFGKPVGVIEAQKQRYSYHSFEIVRGISAFTIGQPVGRCANSYYFPVTGLRSFRVLRRQLSVCLTRYP
jgi:hypothetical protein